MIRRNNKGFSLVELIVVIAIMAVMIGLTVLSISMIFGTQGKECAQKVASRMDSTKTGSMSRYNEVMELKILDKGERTEIKSDGIYADNYVATIKKKNQSFEEYPIGDPETRKMGAASVIVTAYLSDGSSYVLKKDAAPSATNECEKIVIRYDRTSGSFEEADLGSGLISNTYYEKITFERGMRTYAIKFVSETGKYVLERES